MDAFECTSTHVTSLIVSDLFDPVSLVVVGGAVAVVNLSELTHRHTADATVVALETSKRAHAA